MQIFSSTIVIHLLTIQVKRKHNIPYRNYIYLVLKRYKYGLDVDDSEFFSNVSLFHNKIEYLRRFAFDENQSCELR